MTQLKTWSWGEGPGSSRWASCNHRGPYGREAEVSVGSKRCEEKQRWECPGEGSRAGDRGSSRRP